MDDDFFGPPEIDADEWRDTPFRHRYVHGSFAGTATRFVFWFPEPAEYDGRYVQFLQGGMGGSEFQGQLTGQPLVARENRAFYVESNQGHVGNDMSGLKGQNNVLAWRASAQTARLGRRLAASMYGAPPHHGYLYGGSGGGLRAIECCEACPDLWDGVVPFIVNRNDLYLFNWSIAAWAGNVLAPRLAAIVDATSPGGGGNPFAVLANDAERQALAALYRAGFCRGAEEQLEPNPLWILGMNLLAGFDGTYYRDFWLQAGYEGADGDPLAQALRISARVRVRRVLTGREVVADAGPLGAATVGRLPLDAPAAIEVDGDTTRLLGSTLAFTSGNAKGRRLRVSNVVDGRLLALFDAQGFSGVVPGDEADVDNADLVAFCYYHRHLVDARHASMRQFLVDGRPLHTARAKRFDRIPVPTGRFAARMILVQNGADRECWPNCADAYVASVRAQRGGDIDAAFRLWWTENAPHVPPLSAPAQTRLIDYAGYYQQAVRDVIAWVERDVAPPPGTRYVLEDGGRLALPATTAERGGIQPVVRLRASAGAPGTGSDRVDVRAGEPVAFTADAAVPPGTGTFVAIDWDFDGSGTWPRADALPGRDTTLSASVTHTYTQPGTYFATVRVTSRRDLDGDTRLRRLVNVARVRVCVQPAPEAA